MRGKAAVRGAPTASNDDAEKLARLTAPQLDENHAPSCGWRGAACPCRWRGSRASRTRRFGKNFDRDETLCCDWNTYPRCVRYWNTTSTRRAPSDRRERVSVTVRARRRRRKIARLSTSLVTGAPHETSPARLRAATTLALCGWTVATREASSETRVDAAGGGGGGVEPVAAPPARRAAGGKVTGSILRCALCDAKAATWNFADARSGGSGGTDPASRETREGTDAGSSPFGAKKKPKASVAALMGAMGGAFGPSVFDAAPPSAPADPGPAIGASGSGRNADAPV